MCLLYWKGRNLRYSLCCGAVSGGGFWEGTVALGSLAGFHSLSLIPTGKLSPSGADFQEGGFVYVLGPCGSIRWTLLWGWEFSLAALTPTGFYSQRFWGFISPHWNPGLHGLSHSPVVPSSLSAHKCGTTWSASRHLAVGPLHPGCPSYCSGWMFPLLVLCCQTSI